MSATDDAVKKDLNASDFLAIKNVATKKIMGSLEIGNTTAPYQTILAKRRKEAASRLVGHTK